MINSFTAMPNSLLPGSFRFSLYFILLGEIWKALNKHSIYVVDSFPVAVCDNYHIQRSRLYRGEAYRGYQASKKRYFYGIKIHLLITDSGQPVEFFLTVGRAYIERLLPKHIHAVTDKGFELKVTLILLACSLNYLVR